MGFKMVNAELILVAATTDKATLLRVISKDEMAKADARLRRLAAAQGFEAAAGSLLALTSPQGDVTEWLVGAPAVDADPFTLGAISSKLPAGTYRFEKTPEDAHLAALAIEHGLTLCSADSDFARFPSLRWFNPLAN